jgi:predicted peptidase
MPLDYDSAKIYPLVVCLHGSSGRGNDNVKQIGTCLPATLLSNEENRKKYPAFLLVPQCPMNMSWGGTQNTPSVDSLVIETILALEKEFPIDIDRRYVAGNSMGGYGTWHLILTHPEMFAAAIPISGGGDPAFAPKLTKVPIWAFHGAKDMNVPVSGSRYIIEAIKKAGGNPQYSEFPDKAHDITKEVVSTPGLLDWLFAQKK